MEKFISIYKNFPSLLKVCSSSQWRKYHQEFGFPYENNFAKTSISKPGPYYKKDPPMKTRIFL
jgi:hypothetical protein